MTSDEDHISNATNDCERRILSALVFALDEFGYDIAKVMQRACRAGGAK